MDREEIVRRWNNHKNIISILKKTNINKEQLDNWEYQINVYFNSLLKPKL